MRRLIVVAVLALAVLVPIAADTPVRGSEPFRPGADESGTLALAGLSAPASVVTDRWGIPHLRAANLDDLYLVWGYVTARDRLWQIACMRQAGHGLLWQWAGNATLQADGGAQLFRLRERAATIWQSERTNDATRMPLERFAAGVNAWIARCRAGQAAWPPEFTRLGVRPDDWRPEDSVLLLLGMGITLDLDVPELGEARYVTAHGSAWVARRRRFEDRLVYDTVPDSAARRLYGAGIMSWSSDSDAARLPAPTAALAARAADMLAALAPPAGEDGAQRASNVFAVGARRSASGAPLLANDPHLGLSTPGPFHVLHITVPGVVDAAGASLPGLPAIVTGRNRECAWGVTALSVDVADVYADTLSVDGRRVRWDGGWAPVVEKPFDLRFRVAGLQLPIPWQVRRYTPHGPVLVFDRKRHLALSLRWTAFEDDRITLSRMLGLERSRDADELAERYSSLVTPTLNLVAADRGGRVRYRACGLLPRRVAPTTYGPLPGGGSHEWAGFVETAHMPAWSVPATTVVVNANNRPIGPAYPEPLPRFDWAHDRARRIAQRLGGDPSLTLADMRSVQNDVYSSAAARWVPRLVACADSSRERLSPRARAAVDTLRAWDLMARRERVAPTLWRTWYAAFMRRASPEGLPGRALATLDGESGTAAKERPAVAVAAALDTALADLEHLLGPDLASWRWGRAHRARFARDLERWFPKEPEWRTERVPEDGDNSTPCVGASRLPRTVEVVHGPAFRHLVDLSVADSSLAIIPPANLADAGGGARQLAATWANHGYVPLYLDSARVESVAWRKVTLTPR